MLDRIEVRHTPGSPFVDALLGRARDSAARLAPAVEVRAVELSVEEARARYAGDDVALICVNEKAVDPRRLPSEHTEPLPLHRPPQWLVDTAVAHALEPRSILFLCVANSARSQMAEGLARALAPSGVEVASAGSAPTELRREAVDVLREIGIYIANQRAKGVDDIDLDTVQLVVTLCAEEECPVVLKPIPRLSWALSDPAAEDGDPERRREAFRVARDEIRRRLYLLFLG